MMSPSLNAVSGRSRHRVVAVLALLSLVTIGVGNTRATESSAPIPVDSTAEFESRAEPARNQSTTPLAANPGTPGATRFVIALRLRAEHKISSLINPNRVVIDLDSTAIELPPPVGDSPAGLIKSFRGGLSAPGQTRIVIDVVAPVVVAYSAIENVADDAHRRLVVDLVQTAASEQAAALAGSSVAAVGAGRALVHPPMPRRMTGRDIAQQRIYRPTIVIDPGHGGIDSGAQKFGTIEKDVVLAFGHRLKTKLERTGRYKVLMTRETDVFVELDERRLFAERNKAALFIAIHADSASNSARGATIYSLRQSVAEDLMQTAKDEARKDVLSREEIRSINSDHAEIDAVRGFLTDLAQREVEVNRDRTNVFTRSIIEYMAQSTNLKDNPDRTAQYRVLRTAKMPAVLIELAYVSNEEDASNLRSDVWRDKVTQSLVKAIESYFSNNIASLPL